MAVAILRGSTVEALSGLSMVGENVLFTKEEYVSLLLSPGPGKSNRLPIANIACPETDGISFLPALLGETERQKEHEYLYWEYPDPTIGLKAIRMGKWKGIVNNIRKGNSTMELYDLESDLREEHDVAAEHPDIVRKLTRLMEKSHTEPENPKFRF